MDGVAVRTGQYIGLLDGNLVVAGDGLSDVLRDLLQQAISEDCELITLYYGSALSADEAQALVDAIAADFDGQEFEVVPGGQPLYPLVISVE
jgi:dihydroxyacetone kinase-like predicted kinase